MEAKIPYYLRYAIDAIVKDARKHIAIQYLHSSVFTPEKSLGKYGTGCQIVDQNDYSAYFFEPRRYTMPEVKTIRYTEQRSAHQNAIQAIKLWEEELRAFLANPPINPLEKGGSIIVPVRILSHVKRKASPLTSSRWHKRQLEGIYPKTASTVVA